MLEREEGALIVLPNARLANLPVLNLKKSIRSCEVSLFIPLTFQADPHKVQDVIHTILTKHKEVCSVPSPSMTSLDFTHGMMNFELIFWVSDSSRKKIVINDLNLAIWHAFARLAFQFATPPASALRARQKSGITTAQLVDVDEEIDRLKDGLEIIAGG